MLPTLRRECKRQDLPPARWRLDLCWAEPITPGHPRRREILYFFDSENLLGLLDLIRSNPHRPLRKYSIARVIGGRPLYRANRRAVEWDVEKRRRRAAAKAARRNGGAS